MADDSPNSEQRTHEYFMGLAIEHAKTNPLRPFATVVVDAQQTIIAKTVNNVSKCPILHAEIVAIHACAAYSPAIHWKQLTFYTTAEPCVMCQAAIYWSGITRVVYGTNIPFLKTLFGLEIDIRSHEIAARAPVPCEIISGVLQHECDSLFLHAQQLRGIYANT